MFGLTKAGLFKTVSPQKAWDDYCLTARETRKLAAMVTHDADGNEYMLFTRFSLQDAAYHKYGDRDSLDAALEKRQRTRARRMASHPGQARGPSMRPRLGRTTGSKAVMTAMMCNTTIMFMKGGTAMLTGSVSMLSEAVHSAVDVMNQALLAVGLLRSTRAATPGHPYGHGHEIYAYAMLSGVGTFFLGSGVALFHGIHTLLDPQALEHPAIALAVLFGAGLLEGYTLNVAVSEIKHECAKVKMEFWEYLKNGPDPINTAVFLEDAVAVSGVSVAGAGIGLTMLTGNAMFDAVGSITVGVMLGGVSAFLIRKNMTMLGQPVAPRTDAVVAAIEADSVVFSVQDVKSQQLRPGVCRLKAEVHFNPWALCDKYVESDDNLAGITQSCSAVRSEHETRRLMRRFSRMYMLTLSIELDRIESVIRKKYPEFRHIDLEVL